ncbi:MAG: HAD-IA family hydrolase [ANME-2 cluster archaeon]|nr:HAD-IA family hydrolase [ANME-2 cluster archaeon]
MAIKAVLFDLDNTLLDFSEMKRMAVNMAIRAMIDQGLDMDPKEAFESIFQTYWEVGIESDNAFSEFLKRRFGSVDERILAAGVNAYLRTKPSFLEPYPNVVPTLIKLIKHGLIIGIVTDAPRLKGWQRLCAMRLQHFFDHVITRDDSGAPKTDGLPFEYALERLKLEPHDVLFVGDSVERDIIGAKAAGMVTALAAYGTKDGPGDIEGVEPDHILSDFRELLDIIGPL